MALVPRQRKNKIVYYVANKLPGAKTPTFERVGTDKREAERRDAAMKKEIKAGHYRGKSTGGKTMGAQMEIYLTTRATITADDDRGRFRIHVLGRAKWFTEKRLEDLEPDDVIQLADELKLSYVNHRGVRTTLEPRSHANIFKSLLGPFFRYCRRKKMMVCNVMEVPRGTWSGHSKRRKPYDGPTVIAMSTDERLAPHWRMMFTLLFYTGVRIGEACGLTFRDYDRGPKPLGCLTVCKQYNGAKMKTAHHVDDENTRKIPVHPVLAAAIDAWWAHGFEQVYCRKPTPQDFIVPRESGQNQTRHATYEWFQIALDRLSLATGEPTPMHATRNTFISLALRGGARREVLEIITHRGEKGEGGREKRSEIDPYINMGWAPLCEAVLCFQPQPPAKTVKMKRAS